MKDCMIYSDRFTQQKNTWRLLSCLSTKSNDAYNTQDEHIIHQIKQLMQLINHTNFSDPYLFYNISIILQLREILNPPNIYLKLSPQFIENTPNLIRTISKTISTNHALSNESISIEMSNIHGFMDQIFGITLDNDHCDITQHFKLTKLLVLASVKIKQKLVFHEISDKYLQPRLECWKLLYAFIFEFENTVQSYGQHLPLLNDIPYLLDNMMMSNKSKLQINFIQNLVDYYGVIIYDADFIYKDWCYGNISDYLAGWDEISTALRPSAELDITSDDRQLFIECFSARFLLVLLNKAPAYDLTQLDQHEKSIMAILVAQSIGHLYYYEQQQLLFELFVKLRRSKGLYLLKETCIVLDLVEDAAVDHNMSSQIQYFLQTIVYANLRLQGKLADEITEVITDLLCHWLIDKMDSIELSAYRTQVAKELSQDLYHPDLIVELINIHDTYHFVLDNGNTEQLMFFVRFIAELIKQRDDWNYGPKFVKFVLNLDNSSMATLNHVYSHPDIIKKMRMRTKKMKMRHCHQN